MDMRRGRCATAALEMADSRRTPQQQTLSAMFTRSALQNTPSTGSSTGAAGAAATSGIQRRPGSLLAENAENLRRERATQLRIRRHAALQRAERLQRGGMQQNASSQGSFAGAEGAAGAAVASSSSGPSTRAAEHGADVAAVTVSAANWMTSKSMIGTRVTRRNEVATVAANSCVPCIRPRRTICDSCSMKTFSLAIGGLHHSSRATMQWVVPHGQTRVRHTNNTGCCGAPAGRVHVDDDGAVWSRKP